MKYLEEKDLIKGKYYHVQSYNNEHAILKYEQDIPYREWGFGIGWGEIRYVFKEVGDLKEPAKQKYEKTLDWTQERLDTCKEYERNNPRPNIEDGFSSYQRWYKGLEAFMNKHGFY